MKQRVISCLPAAVLLGLLSGWWLSAAAPGGLGGVHPAAFGRHCTSFCLDNAGQAVFGANYDNDIWEGLLFVNKRGVTKIGFEPGTTGRYARWTAEYGSVTFNLAGFQMAWAGLNEAGLAISTMSLTDTDYPPPDERPPLIAPFWVQYQLDTCATVEEVMANDARVRAMGSEDHYLVCDRSGACVAVEFLDGKTVFHSGQAMPVAALANKPYLASVQAWQAGLLEDRARFRIAADRVVNFQPSDATSAVAYAFETLQQASGQAIHGVPTQWSIVFDTANLRVHWRTARNARLRYVDFARLDFACGTPVEMLDVHTPLSGDVSDRLDLYSFRDNLRYTLNFLEKWGHAGVSELEAEVLERGLDSFACERPAAPYQEETGRPLPPVVGWAALALLHRYWPALPAVGLGLGLLALWRRNR